MTHRMKIEQQGFDLIKSGKKKFKICKDDRDPRYREGDILALQVINDAGEYTKDEIFVKVDYIYRGNLCKDGYCILGIHNCFVWG